MNKSDLKDFMVVKFRGFEDLGIITGGNILCKFGNGDYNILYLEYYNSDLRSDDGQFEYDIMSVYKITSPNILFTFEHKDFKEMELIWKREEVDWSKVPIGTKVKVSDDKIEWFNAYFIKKLAPIEDTNFYVINAEGKLSDWSYCKLAEKPKEEVTKEELKEEYLDFMEPESNGYECDEEEIECLTEWILDYYNVTRKDNK